ncbi:hypothetical protein TNCV_109491 [Trichonephila clavipes]|nr:hypothetical protein TNCV_109491 [Trichonephila clavipes]
MDFTEINSREKRGELLGRIDRQNSRFRTAKTIIIKFVLHASFVESESAKNAVNELFMRERPTNILGRGSREVQVSDRGLPCHEFEPSTTKTRRVGQRCTLNLSRGETSSRWCGVEVRRGGASPGVVHVT